MRIIILVVVFFLFCKGTVVEFVTSGGENACATNLLTSEALKMRIIQKCARNERCSRIFHQHAGRENTTLFDYLARSVMKKYRYNYMAPLTQSMCAGKSLEEMAEDVAILTLMAEREENQQICGMNHVLVFDEKSEKTECICAEDKDCGADKDDLTIFYIAVSVALVTLLSICIFQMTNLIISSLNKREGRSSKQQ